MRTPLRRRGVEPVYSLQYALLGGLGTVLGALLILGFAAFLALSGAL